MNLPLNFLNSRCYSLQATWIRNTILHALRAASKDQAIVHRISLNMVYENPTIHALADFMFHTISGSATHDSDIDGKAKAFKIRSLVQKYKSIAPKSFARASHDHGNTIGRIVLVTGTTGRFGCHILAQLLIQEDVAQVYALNRGVSGTGAPTLYQRQIEAFKMWGLDTQLLNPRRMVCLIGRLDQKFFGLECQLYQQVSCLIFRRRDFILNFAAASRR